MSTETLPVKTPAPVRLVHPACNILIIVLGFAGAALAGALYLRDRGAVDLPCTTHGGCEIVAASPYSHITIGPLHDIPVSLLGLIGYITIFTIAMMKAGSETRSAYELLAGLGTLIATGGTAYSWYLQWVAHVIIGAFCIYCRISACIMSAICLVSIVELVLLAKSARTLDSEAQESQHV